MRNVVQQRLTGLGELLQLPGHTIEILRQLRQLVASAAQLRPHAHIETTARHLLQNFNLAALAAAFVGLVVAGAVKREMLPLFLLLAPALMIPSLLGARIYLGLSQQAFRRVVLGVLTLSGLTMVGASLLHLARN